MSYFERRFVVLAALSVLGLHAAGASAGDGVIEINDTIAAAGAVNGNPALDPPGYPVQISKPGSYVLTGSLVVPDGGTTAIKIDADFVTIDLNGFEIRGPNVCSGTPSPGLGGGVVTCSANGRGRGIDAEFNQGIVVKNGTVRGMGSDGVVTGDAAEISHVVATDNGGTGLAASAAAVVSHNRSHHNLTTGIFARSSIVEKNVVDLNGGVGIAIDGSASVEGNTSRGNGGEGFAATATSRATFANNVATDNVSYGISAPAASAATNNVVTFNSCSGISCTDTSGALKFTSCNVVTVLGAPQRRCPSPPNADVIYP